MFLKTVGDLVGVSGTAITRYETGEDKPQRDRLEAIAAQLGFSVDFFTRPGWHEEFEPIFWRSRAAESKQAREMTEQRMKWACEIFSFFEREVNFPPLNLPDVPLPEDFHLITGDMIESAADAVRKHWSLYDRPIPDVALALENAGVPVLSLDILSEKQDGFCFRSATLARPFVGVSTNNISRCRARYDLGHELGHLILHRHVTPQQERIPTFKKLIEQQAHRFAGAFLFPKSCFLREVGYPSLDFFCDLKRRWGMSIGAMIYRAFNLGRIGEAEKTALYQGMSKRKWRGPLQEPFDEPELMPVERPRMLRRAMETVLRESIFGIAAVQSELPFPPNEIELIVGLEKGALTPAPVVEFATPARKRGLQIADLETGTILEFPGAQRKPV